MQNFYQHSIYQHSIFPADYHFVFVYAKITLTLTSILHGVGLPKQYACVYLSVLETPIFDHLFIKKKQYLSKGQAICREISHKHRK